MGNENNKEEKEKEINNWLRREFEKEKNILGKFNENNIVRVERIINGKKTLLF